MQEGEPEMYDFDRITDRRGTDSLKHDFAVEYGLPADVLPLWVADMDFPVAREITEALTERVNHGIYGYSDVKADYAEIVADWYDRHFSWRPEADWLVKTPGVVVALAMAVRAFTEPGDAVLIQPPVYRPFFGVVRNNGRKVVENTLVLKDGHYEIDFEDFEQKIRTEKVRLFILCSPHNPVGRVWTEQELLRIGEICGKYDVMIVSDEIHCDLVRPGYIHTPLLKALPGLKDQCVQCTAPSKTFNLAGLQVSNIWIPDPKKRKMFTREMDAAGLSLLNSLGLVAARAAFQHGDQWLKECLEYLEGNYRLIRKETEEHLPGVKLIEAEGTYFAWLDFSGLGIDDRTLNDRLIHRGKLWLDAGTIFGKEAGNCFQRLAYVSPRSVIKDAMERMRKSLYEAE